MPAGLEVGILAKMSDYGHGILGTLCRSSWGGGCPGPHELRKDTHGGKAMVVDHCAGASGDHLLLMVLVRVMVLLAATRSPTALLGNLPRDGGRDDVLVDRCARGLDRWLFWGGRFWIVQLIEVPLAHTIEIALRLPVAIRNLALLGLGPVFLASALRLDNLATAGEAADSLWPRRLALGTRRCGSSSMWSALRSSLDGFDGRSCSLGSIVVGCVRGIGKRAYNNKHEDAKTVEIFMYVMCVVMKWRTIHAPPMDTTTAMAPTFRHRIYRLSPMSMGLV